MLAMRLINTETMKLEEFQLGDIPSYCILSHTLDDEELLLKDMRAYTNGDEFVSLLRGFAKIRGACQVAKQLGLSHLWVSSCCVDNMENSTELGDAINSMFELCKNSALCIAHLSDVRDHDLSSPFLGAKWFTQGWTLQELIAPPEVMFYSQGWQLRAIKSDYLLEISIITGIDPFVLRGGELLPVPIARRMYWASRRTTKRPEDLAYCLLGLFGVTMPLLYGEGAERAFMRLQREILKTTEDTSIFAWKDGTGWETFDLVKIRGHSPFWEHITQNMLAKAPSDFLRCGPMFPPLGLDYRPPPTGEHGDDDEISLHEESQWETMSVLSTSSTMVQDVEDSPAQMALDHAISFLTDDRDVFPLLEALVRDRDFTLVRLSRVLTKLLRLLATELGSEASTKDESSVAGFIRRYRLLIASSVTTSVIERPTNTKDHTANPVFHTRWSIENLTNEQPPVPSDDEVIPDEEGDEEEIVLNDLEGQEGFDLLGPDQNEVELEFLPFDSFILSSRAYQQMISRLKDLVYPSFRSRACNLSAKVLRSPSAKDWSPEYSNGMRTKMALVVSELIFSRPTCVMVEGENQVSKAETIQNWLESITKQQWNWWPFHRPRPLIGDGECCLGWICSCGDRRWEVVPAEFAYGISYLAKKYPIGAANPAPSASSTANPIASGGAIQSPSGSSKQPVMQGKGVGMQGASHSGPTAGPGAATSNQIPLQQTMIPRARFLFVVGKFGRYRLDELSSLHLDTEQFAHQLRSTYLTRKGLWRHWLSMYGFSHCEFGKFQRYRRNGYAHQGYGLPDPAKKEYYYTETSWEPPISPEEFRHLYKYAASQKSLFNWTARGTSTLPILPQASPHADDEDYDGDIPTDTVDRIPQRYWNMNKKLNTREDFWGIYIKEQRSAVMTALYTLLTLSPFIIFCVLYLLGIIEGDIQNATTPLAISLTAFGMFLSWMVKQ